MLVVALVGMTVTTPARAADIRYSDVMYMDEMNLPPLMLKVRVRAPLMFTRDRSSILGHVSPGQVVTVLGVGETQYYISSQIATGPARGWVRSDAIEPLAPEVLADIKQRRERTQKHKDLIDRHEVAIGMTPEEVRASLGKPDKTTRTVTKEGAEELWSYVTYRYLPQYSYVQDKYGQMNPNVIYQRMPIGHKTIVFRNGEVALIEDHVEDRPPPPVSTVVPPLIIR
jgi:hypothetical protein